MPDRNIAVVALRYNGDENTCWKEEDDLEEDVAATCMVFFQMPAETGRANERVILSLESTIQTAKLTILLIDG